VRQRTCWAATAKGTRAGGGAKRQERYRKSLYAQDRGSPRLEKDGEATQEWLGRYPVKEKKEPIVS